MKEPTLERIKVGQTREEMVGDILNGGGDVNSFNMFYNEMLKDYTYMANVASKSEFYEEEDAFFIDLEDNVKHLKRDDVIDFFQERGFIKNPKIISRLNEIKEIRENRR